MEIGGQDSPVDTTPDDSWPRTLASTLERALGRHHQVYHRRLHGKVTNTTVHEIVYLCMMITREQTINDEAVYHCTSDPQIPGGTYINNLLKQKWQAWHTCFFHFDEDLVVANC
jgi:hypothetical protein